MNIQVKVGATSHSDLGPPIWGHSLSKNLTFLTSAALEGLKMLVFMGLSRGNIETRETVLSVANFKQHGRIFWI